MQIHDPTIASDNSMIIIAIMVIIFMMGHSGYSAFHCVINADTYADKYGIITMAAIS